MMKPIVGQCALYVVHITVYAVYIMTCTKILIEKVLCIYLVWVCTIVLLDYVCASYVCWEWYLKGYKII